MKKTFFNKLIRRMIFEERELCDIGDTIFTNGSTHSMNTCMLDGNKFFLKFSDDDLFEEGIDPSLQILVEYLAYRIYKLYSGINVPIPELIYDTQKQKVGIATSAVAGVHALSKTPYEIFGKMMSQGVYVDILLCNWDVVGTANGNVFIDKDTLTRIDPGGALTFRARGGRKGKNFSAQAKELKRMLNPTVDAGRVLQYADLEVAAKEFLSVSWQTIATEISSVKDEVSGQLESKGMHDLLSQWQADCVEITEKLESRHSDILENIAGTF